MKTRKMFLAEIWEWFVINSDLDQTEAMAKLISLRQDKSFTYKGITVTYDGVRYTGAK